MRVFDSAFIAGPKIMTIKIVLPCPRNPAISVLNMGTKEGIVTT